MLNRPSTISLAALDDVTQHPIIHELEARPNIAETTQAIEKPTSGKAAGSDAIAAEIYKHGGINLTKLLVQLFTIICDSRPVPQDFKDASPVHTYKRKGDRAICDNYRGISRLCIAGKILARIMLNRLARHIADNVLSESRCGFRAGRGTADMILAMRKIQEKCREQNQDQGTESNAFTVSNGTKQGCVMSPMLFSIIFSNMLQDAFRENDLGVYIPFRANGSIFNLQRLKAKIKITELLVRELLFADDCALITHILRNT